MATGWAFPSNARKAHAFDTEARDAATSLCGRWWLPSVLREGFEFDGALDSPPTKDDCTACRRAVEKRTAA